jgi:twitching motility protein PilI
VIENPGRTRKSPYHLLLEIEQISKARAQGFPNQGDFREKWSGIAFELNNQKLLAPMKSVSEVMLPSALTHIPGVKPWVLGIANRRGNLLPIMGLRALLYGGGEAANHVSERIIVVQHSDTSAGLMVDSVWGLKHFWVDERSERIPPMSPELESFVTHSYRRDEEHYPVFSLERLVESDIFKNIVV